MLSPNPTRDGRDGRDDGNDLNVRLSSPAEDSADLEQAGLQPMGPVAPQTEAQHVPASSDTQGHHQTTKIGCEHSDLESFRRSREAELAHSQQSREENHDPDSQQYPNPAGFYQPPEHYSPVPQRQTGRGERQHPRGSQQHPLSGHRQDAQVFQNPGHPDPPQRYVQGPRMPPLQPFDGHAHMYGPFACQVRPPNPGKKWVHGRYHDYMVPAVIPPRMREFRPALPICESAPVPEADREERGAPGPYQGRRESDMSRSGYGTSMSSYNDMSSSREMSGALPIGRGIPHSTGMSTLVPMSRLAERESAGRTAPGPTTAMRAFVERRESQSRLSFPPSLLPNMDEERYDQFPFPRRSRGRFDSSGPPSRSEQRERGYRRRDYSYGYESYNQAPEGHAPVREMTSSRHYHDPVETAPPAGPGASAARRLLPPGMTRAVQRPTQTVTPPLRGARSRGGSPPPSMAQSRKKPILRPDSPPSEGREREFQEDGLDGEEDQDDGDDRDDGDYVDDEAED
ncbi:hypothetical protein MKZ38_006807 [Zalerion maritima]|uniref:Uncharacterized protein n=1 Tax=Zalerion maritima TaxID=339359 RepID=A0AAD5RWD2_9PEZI|nr:hypothetical protein MKZ38_006807 [Zalerion maritima]